MALMRSFRQLTSATSATWHSRDLKDLLQTVSGVLVHDQCGIGNINIAFLAHSSLVSLVDRLPSSLAGIVVVNHFHLRVPKRLSVLPPGERTHAHEATISCAAYIDREWKAQFFLDGNANPPTLPLPAQSWYRISVVSAT